jgi:hypothetical protein
VREIFRDQAIANHHLIPPLPNCKIGGKYEPFLWGKHANKLIFWAVKYHQEIIKMPPQGGFFFLNTISIFHSRRSSPPLWLYPCLRKPFTWRRVGYKTLHLLNLQREQAPSRTSSEKIITLTPSNEIKFHNGAYIAQFPFTSRGDCSRTPFGQQRARRRKDVLK